MSQNKEQTSLEQAILLAAELDGTEKAVILDRNYYPKPNHACTSMEAAMICAANPGMVWILASDFEAKKSQNKRYYQMRRRYYGRRHV